MKTLTFLSIFALAQGHFVQDAIQICVNRIGIDEKKYRKWNSLSLTMRQSFNTCFKKELDRIRNEQNDKKSGWCEPRQLVTDTGFCEDCPAYQKPDSQGKKCIDADCGGKSHVFRLLPDATCQQCPPYTQTTRNGKSCTAPDCGRKKINPNGSCSHCDPFFVLASDGKSCIKGTCEEGLILLPDGSCQRCPPYMKSTDDEKSCVSPVCSSNQRKNLDGSCSACPAGSRPSNDQRTCLSQNDDENVKPGGSSSNPQVGKGQQIKCSEHEVKLNGKCVECKSNQIIRGGECYDCPDYTGYKPGNFCGADACNIKSKLQKDGSCKVCPSFFTPTKERDAEKDCYMKTCKANEILTSDGLCHECKKYTRPVGNIEQQHCHQDHCTSRQVLQIDGTCLDCPDWHAPGSTECHKPVCTGQHINKIDGKCHYCGPYKRQQIVMVLKDGIQEEVHECRADECSDDTRLMYDGSCEACPEGHVKDKGNPRQCISFDNCSYTQIRLLNKKCQECPSGHRWDKDLIMCVGIN